VVPTATIIIPHYKSQSLTLACLRAIAETTDVEHEIIIVDNGTGHDLPSRVIRNETNRGFAIACNQGAAAASGETLVFLNDDTEPPPDWLQPLLAAFTEDRVAAAAPRIINPDGTLQGAGMEIVAHRNGELEPFPCVKERSRGLIRLAGAACLAISAPVC
jgi:GT2 family glycosyltransferase